MPIWYSPHHKSTKKPRPICSTHSRAPDERKPISTLTAEEETAMSADHYLTGPCEGMSLHRDGKLLTLKDSSGREEERTYNCDDENHADESLWRWRGILYARYDSACLDVRKARAA